MLANPFQTPWVAPAYAAARPNVHDRFVEVARREMGSPPVLPRALDIGCGTGLASRSLGGIAERVVGIDPAISMLRCADAADGLAYVAADSAAVPAAGGVFDIASISCAFHWCDRTRLFAEVARVVRPGGWFLIFDSDLLGWSDGSREPVERLLAEYWSQLPACPRNLTFDPTCHVAEPFALHTTTSVSKTVVLSPAALTEFVLTRASTLMAIVSGHASPADLRERLERCLLHLFAGATTRELLFGGDLHVLRRAHAIAGTEAHRRLRHARSM